MGHGITTDSCKDFPPNYFADRMHQKNLLKQPEMK